MLPKDVSQNTRLQSIQPPSFNSLAGDTQINTILEKVFRNQLLTDIEKKELIRNVQLSKPIESAEKIKNRCIRDKHELLIQLVSAKLNLPVNEGQERLIQRIDTALTTLTKTVAKLKEENEVLFRKMNADKKKVVMIITQLEKKLKAYEEQASDAVKRLSLVENQTTLHQKRNSVDEEDLARVLRKKDELIHDLHWKKKMLKLKMMALVIDVQRAMKVDSDSEALEIKTLTSHYQSNDQVESGGKVVFGSVDRELQAFKELWVSVTEADNRISNKEELQRLQRFGKKSVSPESMINIKNETNGEKERSLRFQSIETLKVSRDGDHWGKGDMVTKQFHQISLAFQARVISKYKKFMNKSFKGQILDPSQATNLRAYMKEAPSKFKFYQKAKLLNLIYKSGKIGRPFGSLSVDNQKSSPSFAPVEQPPLQRNDTDVSARNVIKEEILRQKLGANEIEILLAEKSIKVTELKQVNECLLNEIDRKEKHLEQLEVSQRSQHDKDGSRSPRPAESRLSMEKTCVLLHERLREKEEVIKQLRAKLDVETQSVHVMTRSAVTENEIRKSAKLTLDNIGKYVNISEKDLPNRSAFSPNCTIYKNYQYLHGKKPHSLSLDVSSGVLLRQVSLKKESRATSPKQQMEEFKIDNTGSQRFSFGQGEKGASLNERRLEQENKMLKVSSLRAGKIEEFLKRFGNHFITKIDKESTGIEEAELRVLKLMDQANMVKFICQELAFKASKLGPIIKSMTDDVGQCQKRVVAVLDSRLAKQKQRTKIVKDKLLRLKSLMAEIVKESNYYKSVRGCLEVEPSPNQLQQCLTNIRNMMNDKWLVEVLKQQFYLSSTREGQIEEIKQMKKALSLVSELETHFKISLETDTPEDIVKALLEQHQKSQMLDQVTSLLEVSVDPEDGQSNERFLTAIVKIKAILRNLEGEMQSSFKNLSSKDIDDFFLKYKPEQGTSKSANEQIDKLKQTIAETLKPPFIDETNFVEWFARYCQDLVVRQADSARQLQAKELDNQKFIDRFIEMQTDICNLKEQLENKSKHLEQEKKKINDSSVDNQKTESLKIKIKNMQKNIADLERKLEVCKEVLGVVGLSVNDKDLKTAFEEKLEELRKEGGGQAKIVERKKTPNKRGNTPNMRQFGWDALQDLGQEAMSLYVSEHRGGRREEKAKEEGMDNSASERTPPGQHQKKSYFVKSFLNVGGKK